MVVGNTTCDVLRSALLAAGFSAFTGEPDLFCWHPETGKRFFAEQREVTNSRNHNLSGSRCVGAPLETPDIRVYRLRPKEHKTPSQALEDIGA